MLSQIIDTQTIETLALSPCASGQDCRQVAFIDAGITGCETLAELLAPAMPVVLLTQDADGLGQIAAWTAGRSDLAAIHIVSHGRPGVIELAGDELPGAALGAPAARAVLGDIGAALAADGQLLMYGCATGAGAEGAAFVAQMARLTGATVGASSEPTGAADLGGDWGIDVMAGPAGFPVPVAARGLGRVAGLDAYEGLLALGPLAYDSAVVVATGHDMSSDQPGTAPLQVLGNIETSDGNRVVLVANGVSQYFHFTDQWEEDVDFSSTNYDNLQLKLIDAAGNVTTKLLTGAIANVISNNGGISHYAGNYPNRDTINTADSANLTALKDGGFVVVSGSSDGYAVQRYDNAGNALPTASPFGASHSANATVNVLSTKDGGYIVLWTMNDRAEVHFQRYDSAGAAVGGEVAQQIPAGTTRPSLAAGIAVDEHGNLAVTFDPANETGASAVYLWDANNQLVSQQPTAYFQQNVLVTAKAGGGFALFGHDLAAGGAANTGLHVQYLDEAGSLGAAIQNVAPLPQQVPYGDAPGYLYFNNAQTMSNGDYLVNLSDKGVFVVSGTAPAAASTWQVVSEADAGSMWSRPILAADGSIVATRVEGSESSYTMIMTGSLTSVNYALAPPNSVPTLTTVTPLAGGTEDTVKEVSFADLQAAGNEADSDGTVAAFVVKSVTTGTLKIGADAASATAWVAGGNDVIDATHKAFWTPAADANGSGLNAFKVVARDNGNAVSATPVQVRVDVAAVPDAPVAGAGTSLQSIAEDVPSLDHEDVSGPNPPNWGEEAYQLMMASGYANADGNVLQGIAIAGNAADPVTEGRWQYSTDPGAEFWHDIGTVSPAAALVLLAGMNGTAYIRFVPVADFNGTPGALTVHAIDDTGFSWSTWDGTAEVRHTYDTTADDATSHVSANGAAWTITVDAVNDKPVVAHLGHTDDQTTDASDAAVTIDIDGNATVSDVDNATFDGGMLSVTIASGADAGDILGIKTGAHVALSNGNTFGSLVSIDGVAIGHLTIASGLAIALNANATPERVSILLQNLTFDTTGQAGGDRTIGVSFSDGAGGVSDIAETTITVTTMPTLAIVSDVASVRAGETALLTLTFSAAPANFELADLTVTGGSVGNLQATNDPLKFTAVFTPAEDVQSLQAAISIAAGKFDDGNGKNNIASTVNAAIAVDTLAPGVAISAGQSTVKAGDTLTLKFTFTEAPVDFVTGDVVAIGGAVTNLHATSDSKVWEATFTPQDGIAALAATVSIAASAFDDTAGNASTASNVLSITGDTAPPVVASGDIAISGASGAGGAFVTGDTVTVSWNGTANADLATVSVDFTQFGGGASVAATHAGGVWTATYMIAAGSIDATGRTASLTATDAAGNATTRVSATGSVVDNQAPMVTGAAIATGNGATGSLGTYRIGDTVTATWNAAGVNDVASVEMDFSQFGGGSAVAATHASGVWTASYTITAATLASGAHNVGVVVTDDAGNRTTGHGTGNLAVDAAAPAVSAITVVGTPAAAATSIQFQVKLSEAVSGLDAGDFVLHTGGLTTASIGNVTASGSDTYLVTVDGIAGNGSVRLDLKSAGTGIADAAGNAVAGGYTAGAVHTVSFNAAPVITSNDGGATATVKLAEKYTAVTTVQAGDADGHPVTYSISGGAQAALFEIDAASGALKFKAPPVLSSTPGANDYEVVVAADDGHGGTDSQVLTVQVLRDIDGDGVPDALDNDADDDGIPNVVDDAVPSAHGGFGDGNGDGIADSLQANVASLPTSVAGNPYATLAVAAGYTLTGLSASAAPGGLPRSVKLPVGQLDFTIGNVTPGGTVEMSIYVDSSLNVNAYYKQDNTGAWKNIAKSVSTVGSKTRITFELTDGGILDSDHAVNGSISDPGGVALITPQIISNGGETTAAVQVAENTTKVTTVAASALGTVTYSIAGGADAALFKIDAASGVLKFIAAPNFEKPLDQGDGAGNNTYVVEVQATDGSGSETQKLTVRVTDVNEDPPLEVQVVDGVKVETRTQQNADGSTSRVFDIPVVQATREDTTGGGKVADIALASAGGVDILAAQLPTGYGLHVVGQATPGTAGNSLADLIREINAHTQSGSQDQASLAAGGSGFLGGLGTSTPLLVQSITATAGNGVQAADGPIVIRGQQAVTGGVQTALVLDTSALPSGTHVELQDVGFVAVVGTAHITGGNGSQEVWGDSASQYIVLGADDDVLHGGDGDDTIGSAGGNDRVFGDAGNDVVFGGIGNDTIDGGTGTDTVLLAGASRNDFSLRFENGVLVSTALGDGTDGTDHISAVEIMQFAGADLTATGVVSRLYEALLGRAADTAGREYWVAQHAAGMSLEDIANGIAGSGEALQAAGTNGSFVSALYQGVLGRAADAGGLAYWTAALDDGSVTRAGLALQMTGSAEKLAMASSAQLDFNRSDVATLVRMYEALLGRHPDEAGLNFWIGAHEAGTSMRSLAQGFLASSESAAHYASLDDAQFVTELYETALGHGPTAAEASAWTGMLAAGQVSRGDVLLGIADSDEMASLVGVISTTIEMA